MISVLLVGNGNVAFHLKNAFLQIPLSSEAKKLTVINTPFGLFEFNFLPFGLTVSPSIFQQTIEEIISGIQIVIAFQADLLIFFSSTNEHIKTLNSLFGRL